MKKLNIYYNIANVSVADGGGGGGATTIVDFEKLKGTKLGEDLAGLTAAKAKVVEARNAAMNACGGQGNPLGNVVAEKLQAFDEENFKLAIAEINKLVESAVNIGNSYETSFNDLVADVGNIQITEEGSTTTAA